MGLTVYGGGGKPEEEKTVTAGTSVIEVNPSSGKVMKKVTVNPTPTESKNVTAGTSDITVSPIGGKHLSGITIHPTPSQEKTVIPTAEGFKVSPETGKFLSAVFVDGDSDLVAENIKEGVNIFGVDGSFDNSHGAYVWKKLTAEGGDFIDFVVSDSETAYPNSAVHTDGYWYERVGEIKPEMFGCSKIAIDKYTPTANGAFKNIPHSLGQAPSLVIVIASGIHSLGNAIWRMFHCDNINGGSWYDSSKDKPCIQIFYSNSYKHYRVDLDDITKTASTITAGGLYLGADIEYTIITGV